jgi:hypothetical protein
VVVQGEASQRVLSDRGLEPSADSIAVAKGQLDPIPGVAKLPKKLRDQLVTIFSSRFTLEQALVDEHRAELVALARVQCTSGRFVSHILVKTEAEANAVRDRLAKGEPFADVARSVSTDTGSGLRGGQLGCPDNQNYVPEFKAAVDSATVGVVTAPVQSQFGYHVILVRDTPGDYELTSFAQTYLAEALGAVKVSVSDRFGAWNRKQGRVCPPSGC